MSYGFPDWMFAGIAIAAYELAAWVRHQFHFPQAIWIAYGIIVVCAIVILIRIVARRARRRDSEETPQDDDWKNY